MSPTRLAADLPVLGFPRVSGDEPSSRETLPSETMFSPRERG